MAVRQWLKKHSGIIYIVLATAVVIYLVVTNDDLPSIIEALKNLDVVWIWACAGLSVCYLLLRAITLLFVLHIQSERLSPVNALIVTGIGQFYSAITPSSSGGQPMQLMALHRMGVPMPSATAALSMKYVGFQSAFIILGIFLWAFNADLVTTQLYGLRWLVVIGFVLNALIGVLLMLMSVNVNLVEKLVRSTINLAGRLKLVKDVDNARKKAMKYMYDYREAVLNLKSHPLSAIMIMILSFLQVLSFTGVAACLYKAFGLEGYSYFQLTTLQTLLFLAASFMPMPGAAGAQEGGFFIFFKGVFPENGIIAAMLCWRLFTYYFLMIAGLAGVVFDKIREMVLRRRKSHED